MAQPTSTTSTDRYIGLRENAYRPCVTRRLGGAHGDAIEGDVVIHRIGVADEAVVGNDFDACGFGFFGGNLGGLGDGGAVHDPADDDPLAVERLILEIARVRRDVVADLVDRLVTFGFAHCGTQRVGTNPRGLDLTGLGVPEIHTREKETCIKYC